VIEIPRAWFLDLSTPSLRFKNSHSPEPTERRGEAEWKSERGAGETAKG